MLLNVEKISELVGHKASIYELNNAAQPNIIYSGSIDKQIIQWDLSTFQPTNFYINLPETIYSIVHDIERKTIYVGSQSGKIYFIDLTAKKEFKVLFHHSQAIFSLKQIKDKLIAASADGSISVVNLNTYTLTYKKVMCVEKVRAIDYKNQLLAIACGDGSIRILDSETLTEIQTISAHQLSCNAVKFHPNSRYLVSGGRDAHLRIWDINSNFSLVKEIAAHNFAIYSIDFSNNATLFATASRDKTVKLWNAETFDILIRINKEKLDGHTNSVNKVLWSSFNNYLISAGDDKKIMIWKVSN